MSFNFSVLLVKNNKNNKKNDFSFFGLRITNNLKIKNYYKLTWDPERILFL